MFLADPSPVPDAGTRPALARYDAVRRHTLSLVAGLEPEDLQLQPTADASPAKWHLAHTAWFFETFVLAKFAAGYQVFHPRFNYLFNSYYNAVGDRHPRPERGLLSRPTVGEVLRYRQHVDAAMATLLAGAVPKPACELVELGLHHEQQHQELLLTDLKAAFARNPLAPTLEHAVDAERVPTKRVGWLAFPGGLAEVGHAGGGFAFDNESPRHQTFLQPFAVAGELVTVGEFTQFIREGGYERPEFWLADGWATVVAKKWEAPEYWRPAAGDWEAFTLAGWRPLADHEPVRHVSFYEADAYARWAGERLPTEAEWEVAAAHPAFAQRHDACWQWTASPYVAYPGFRPAAGAVGEYNGKFMCNQMVLRGGSCGTPAGHTRATYRNFFPPEARWQFTGIRLARDV